MTSPLGLAAALARVWRWEGGRAARDRVADRLADRRRRLAMAVVPASTSWEAWSSAPPPPVLNLSPLPPVPRRGGSQLQLLARLEAESRARGVALLYPVSGGWCLEWWEGARRVRRGTGGEKMDAAAVAMWAAGLSATSVVHLESPAGLPLATAPEIRSRGLDVVLGVHDFTLFCRRPHLLEQPCGRFCEFCTDLGRCGGCLAVDGDETPADQTAYRRAGAAALATATAVVYPSEYLRECHARLFPATGPRREWVIAPATDATASGPCAPRRGRRAVVAFVGGVKPEKGGGLVPRLWDDLKRDHPDLRGVVLGGGDPDLLDGLRRRPGLVVRGYYRAGALPRLLHASSASVAVLASLVPESYALVVDECLWTGVPVVAFDHGAAAERLRRWGVGRLVPVSSGALGLAAAAAELLGSDEAVSPGVRAQLPSARSSAAQMLELYRAELA